MKLRIAQGGQRQLSQPFRKTSTSRNTAQVLSGTLAIAGVLLAGIAVAQKPPASPKVKHGEAIFKTQCIGCHTKEAGDTTPFGPPNLHGAVGKPPLLTPEQAMATIKQGKGAMPSFEGKLNDGDISAVVAYLKTL